MAGNNVLGNVHYALDPEDLDELELPNLRVDEDDRESVNTDASSTTSEMVRGLRDHVRMDSPQGSEEMQILRDETDFIQNVSQFYNQESLSDVILKVGDTRFYGHKFVLAKSSEVFRCMLYERPWLQNVGAEVELNESPECQAVFDKFLKYLYTAGVSINPESAVGILCLADKYNIPSLRELCTSYMIQNSKGPYMSNALNWYSWAKALNLEALLHQCMRTIAWNAQDIMSSTEWLSMDLQFICDVLENSELIVQNENFIFEVVQRWLLEESHMPSLNSNASRLLPLIRFPQMLVTQLHQIEKSDLAKCTECGDLLRRLLGKAYRFRSLCPDQSILQISFGQEAFFLPRDYTDLTVDEVSMQNTLRFGIQVDVRMYRGPVPSSNRDGEWKITYRKNSDVWALQIYCHDSAMGNNEANIQCSVIIFNEDKRPIQVQRVPTFACSRGNNLTMTVNIEDPENSKAMSVLIKPIAY